MLLDSLVMPIDSIDLFDSVDNSAALFDLLMNSGHWSTDVHCLSFSRTRLEQKHFFFFFYCVDVVGIGWPGDEFG